MSRKALVVGISNYPTAPLAACVNDALSISNVIKTNGDGSPNFGVKTLISTNEAIDRPKLKREIDNLFSGSPDVSLLYFSGHGCITNTGGYIVTPDSTQYDEGVSMTDILSMANRSQAKNKIIILDCCFAGAFGSTSSSGGNISELSDGLTVLTASRSSESAMATEQVSVFTSLLLDALHGGAANLAGSITPGSIYSYIDQSLGPWGQRPIFKTNVERFISLRNIAPLVPLNELRKIVELFPTPESSHDLNPSYEFTNDPSYKVELKEPYALNENVTKLKALQLFVKAGLVRPTDAEHMYFAAMHSKACRLTASGAHYWRLVSEGLI